MCQASVPWKEWRKIHLLKVETMRSEVEHLKSKLSFIQTDSCINLRLANIELSQQVALRKRIRWEIISKDMKRLRAELITFCTSENVKLTKSGELYINLFTKTTPNCPSRQTSSLELMSNPGPEKIWNEDLESPQDAAEPKPTGVSHCTTLDEDARDPEFNTTKDLPPDDEKDTNQAGDQPSTQKYIPPHKQDPSNENIGELGPTFLCYLCREMHKRGSGTLAGKVTSSLLTCQISKSPTDRSPTTGKN
jgi:hypothetical protein